MGGYRSAKERNMRHSGILDSGTNFQNRVHTVQEMVEIVKGLRALKQKIVLTSGTYDIIHVGHANYLEKARALGNFLIVGVDSDKKVQKRKGPDRPIVPQDERLLMLAHLRHVDALVLKDVDDPEHHLMKMVQPDVLVISETTKHSQESVADMKKYCGAIELLEPQAQTSTTAQIRRLHIDGVQKYADQAAAEIGGVLRGLVEKMRVGE
jgi:D-beta-D-heptose 7-phosphate kinase/D-beta-D-heptose 1-phosphate adenosyltransferase